jgi:hypothetical protein
VQFANSKMYVDDLAKDINTTVEKNNKKISSCEISLQMFLEQFDTKGFKQI